MRMYHGILFVSLLLTFMSVFGSIVSVVNISNAMIINNATIKNGIVASNCLWIFSNAILFMSNMYAANDLCKEPTFDKVLRSHIPIFSNYHIVGYNFLGQIENDTHCYEYHRMGKCVFIQHPCCSRTPKCSLD